jgi:PAS domain S-box-containing protein
MNSSIDNSIKERQRLCQMIETIHLGYFFTGIDGKVLLINQETLRIFGFNSFEETEHLNVNDLYVFRERRQEMFEELKIKEVINNWEIDFYRKNKTIVHTSCDVNLVKDEHGNPIGLEGIIRDLSFQKKLEKELDENKRNLQTILDNVEGMIYRCAFNKDWTSEFVSDGTVHLTGYKKEDFLENIVNFGKIIHFEDIDRVWEEVEEAVKNKVSYNLEYRIRKSDGMVIWVLDIGKGIFDQNNKLLYLEGLITDISTHKELELELQRKTKQLEEVQQELFARNDRMNSSNEQLRKVLKHMRVEKKAIDACALVSFTDDKGVLIEANRLFCETSGYSFEELIGKSHNTIKSSFHSKEFFQEMWTTITKGGIWRGEICNKKKNGKKYWVDTVIVPFLDDKGIPYRYMCMQFDTTERKEYESSLKETNEELQTTEEELRQQTEELRTTNENLESVLNELKEAQNQLVQHEKMAALGQLIAGVAHEINTPLGAIRSSIHNISQSLDKQLVLLPDFLKKLNENELGHFKSLIEKTSLKKEQNITGLEERRLRQGVKQKLDEAELSAISTIAATIIVQLGLQDDIELLIPLLKGNAGLAILEQTQLAAGLKKSAGIVDVAAERSTKVVFALKSYARFGQTESRTLGIISEQIDTVLTLHQNQIKRGVEIVKVYQYNEPILCFPDELNQVWTNLIHNALQAMDYKGKLTIKVYKQDNQIVSTFTDTGSGIPVEIKHKIFNPFFTTKKIGEGTGLGLDIVKKIIEKHEGSIDFESEVGKGTTFIVHLPELKLK